jgi:uncharacterized membrane protein
MGTEIIRSWWGLSRSSLPLLPFRAPEGHSRVRHLPQGGMRYPAPRPRWSTWYMTPRGRAQVRSHRRRSEVFLLLIVSPAAIKGIVRTLTAGELSEDPHDFIATRLLHTAGGLTGAGPIFGAVYQLIDGVVKMTLVIALLRNQLWAYPWMIAVLVAIIAYQIYLIVLGPRTGLVVLTVFDVLVAGLTWREYRKQRGVGSADD